MGSPRRGQARRGHFDSGAPGRGKPAGITPPLIRIARVRLARRGTFFQRHERVGVVNTTPPLDKSPGVVPSSGGVVGQAPGADDAPGVRPHTDSPASTAPIPTGHVPHIGATVSDAGSHHVDHSRHGMQCRGSATQTTIESLPMDGHGHSFRACRWMGHPRGRGMQPTPGAHPHHPGHPHGMPHPMPAHTT